MVTIATYSPKVVSLNLTLATNHKSRGYEKSWPLDFLFFVSLVNVLVMFFLEFFYVSRPYQ